MGDEFSEIWDSNFFDTLGMKYEEAFGHDSGLINFVKLALEMMPKNAAALDIGCGTGKPVCSMIAESGRKVHGIDNSRTMVALSRKQVPQGLFEEIGMLEFQPSASVVYDAIFILFSHFCLDCGAMGPLLKKIHSWSASNALVFIGTMAADDFEGPVMDSGDDYGGRRVPSKFFGLEGEILVYPKTGWVSMLQQAGFEVLKTLDAPFLPPAECDCNFEPHHYIVARKVIGN